MIDYERTKLEIGGETFFYDDETDADEYRASLVPTAAVIPETLYHPEMLDMTHPEYKFLNLRASLDQYDDQIEARFQENAQELAQELIAQGVKVNANGDASLAADEETKRVFRLRMQNHIFWRIRTKQEEYQRRNDCILSLFEINLTKAEAKNLYQVWGITYGTVPQGDGVTVYRRIEDSVKAEKTIDEILDDPDLILQYAAIRGRTHIPVKTLKPFEILDAQPEKKERAILLLVNREGGVQPIYRSKGEGYEILAIAEKTEKGVRLSGIIQIERRSELFRRYRERGFTGESVEPKKDPPEQWAVLLTDIGADPV